jgi:hypothetical protein
MALRRRIRSALSTQVPAGLTPALTVLIADGDDQAWLPESDMVAAK